MSRSLTVGFLVSSLILLAPLNPTGPFNRNLCAESGGTCIDEVRTKCVVDGVLTLDARNP